MKALITTSSKLRLQKGLSSVEFGIIAIPVLLAGLSSIEASNWFLTKHNLSLALTEAARLASTKQANPQQIEQAFEQALLPLFSPAGQFSNSQQRRDYYFKQLQQKSQLPPWQIRIIQPSVKAFNDFAKSGLKLDEPAPYPAIDNYYQYEQHLSKQKGQQSGLDIFQANTLTLELSYFYKPIVPGMSAFFKWLSPSNNSYSSQMRQSTGTLLISQKTSISMQSHPVLYPDLSNGKVIRAELEPYLPNKNDQSTMLCKEGIWCGNNLSKTSHSASPGPRPPARRPSTELNNDKTHPETTDSIHNDTNTQPSTTHDNANASGNGNSSDNEKLIEDFLKKNEDAAMCKAP